MLKKVLKIYHTFFSSTMSRSGGYFCSKWISKGTWSSL